MCGVLCVCGSIEEPKERREGFVYLSFETSGKRGEEDRIRGI